MTIQATMSQSSNILRRALQANGVFSGLSGFAFIIGAQPIAEFLGLANLALFVGGTGAILVGYAAWLFYISTQATIDRNAAIFAIVSDAIWVAITGVVLMTNIVPLTNAGWWATAIVGDVVAVFAMVQAYGLWKNS